MHRHPTRLTQALAAAGLLCASLAGQPVFAQAITLEQLAKKLEAVERQNAELLQKVQRLEGEQNKQATQVQQQAQAVQKAQETATAVATAAATAAATATATANATTASARSADGPATVISGYGEIGYSRPSKSAKDTNVDVSRAVLGVQHRFDSNTKVVAEFEWEHAIVSAGDKGEAEVEQLWVEREFGPGLRARAGLFLMPVGLINQNHEPTAYYGVFRPSVDTKIVPSTWREVGLGLAGDTANGLTWDVAVTTVPNLSKWDPASTEGRVRGPLAATHGEGQFAAARDLGVVGALNWRGVPGLLVGGSMFYGKLGHQTTGFLGNDSKLLLLDVHARYQSAGFDLSGAYIRGTISNTEALNASYAASATPNPTLVPQLFYGGYVQAAYKVWQRADYTLAPFVRYEVLNTAAGFGSLPVSAGGIKSPTETIITVGANFRIGEGVVLKADYRNNRRNKLPDTEEHFNLGNSFNLGVGFSF